MMGFFRDDRFFCKGMIITIILGIAIRLIIGVVLKFNEDAYSWAVIISNIEAGSGLYDVSGYNYPPVWGYILAFFSQIMTGLGVADMGVMNPELLHIEPDRIAYVTTFEFNFALTVMLTIADLMTAYVAYYVAKDLTNDEIKAKITFALFFLAFHVIIICTSSAMFDSISALLTMLCVLMLVKGKDILAGGLLATAVFLKLFPGFIIFILIAYLIVNDRDQWKKRLFMAASGAIAVSAVIMVPHILEGHLVDSLSFIFARVTSDTGIGGWIISHTSTLMYVIILVLEVLLAIHYYKKKPEGNEQFFLYVFIAVIIVLLYPGTPQYVILMTPFLAIAASVYNQKFRKPLFAMMVFTSMFALSSLDVQFLTVQTYTELMSMELWDSIHELFHDNYLYVLIGGIGGVGQYICILWTMVIALEEAGINVLKTISKRIRSKDAENSA